MKSKLRKLSKTTELRDCASDIQEFSGLKQSDILGNGPNWYKYPKIGDLNHDIWFCSIRGKRILGKSMEEVNSIIDSLGLVTIRQKVTKKEK